MGIHANKPFTKIVLMIIGSIVTALNILLLVNSFTGK
jgi:hypothetical protein